jgi:hypothetical protein
MEHWKDKKTVQVAIGATIILVFAWWMLTGDIPLLANLVLDNPADGDGKVQSVNLWPIVGSMLVQACWIVGGSAIALVCGLWSIVSAAIAKSSSVSPPPVTAAKPKPEAVESPEGLMRGLVRAVATRDAASKLKYETQIRMPYAMQGLVSAIEEGDFAAADTFYAEIRELHGIKSARSAKAGDK